MIITLKSTMITHEHKFQFGFCTAPQFSGKTSALKIALLKLEKTQIVTKRLVQHKHHLFIIFSINNNNNYYYYYYYYYY